MQSEKIYVFAGIFALSLLTFTAGCTKFVDLPVATSLTPPPGTASPVVEKESIGVPPFQTKEMPPSDYHLGPGDILFVNVLGKPELSSVIPPSSKILGSRIDGEGFIRLPLMGTMSVAGLTLKEVEARLTEKFRPYLENPSVVAEISEYKSQPVYLLGQFKVPGTYYMDRPLTLLQGLALGSGFDQTAELRNARLIRDRKILPVDIYGALMEGDANQNVWLKPGDTIYVPDNHAQNVFVFGAVKKGGPVPVPQEGLTLTQAVASAELRDTGFDDRHVRIIRSFTPTRGELIVIDFARIVRGEASPFPLKGGDVVYVPKSGVGNWNDTVNEILPSLQAFSLLLQPFVSIKYLNKN